MLSHRSIGFRSCFVLVLLTLVSLSFWSWLFIWGEMWFADHTALEGYCLYNEFLLIGIVFGLGDRHRSLGPHHEFVDAARRSVRQAILGLFGVLALVFMLHDNFVSRSFLITYVPWLGLALFFGNYLAPRWLSKCLFSGDRAERVALAGTPEQASRLGSWLEHKRLVGFHSIGIVCPQPVVKLANGNGNSNGNGNGNGHAGRLPVLGSLDEMDLIIKKESITQVIVLDLSVGAARLQQLTQLCEDRNIRLLALDNTDSYFNHTTTVFEDDGMRVIGLRHEPLESPANRIIKRVLDVAVSLPVVIFLLPFVHVFVWLLQRWQSPGPVFFRQERVGMMGQGFMMFKYRTMHVNHGNEARQASKGDDRIFPAGRWMRKLSVDELPQFINVLKGDMSVVGPRPHLRQHEELWVSVMGKYVIRRFIRPGITGNAQIKGFRGEVLNVADIERRVEMDIQYLENWSLSLDIAIILKTIKQCVIPPRSAY